MVGYTDSIRGCAVPGGMGLVLHVDELGCKWGSQLVDLRMALVTDFNWVPIEW